jgi:hypothetical protein|tara:strand:+ start:630 stop:1229 length:600 start_codon:yes stop_codon:yes gene_type:complete
MAYGRASLRLALDCVIYFDQSYSDTPNSSIDDGWIEAAVYYYHENIGGYGGNLAGANASYHFIHDSNGTEMAQHRLNSNTSNWVQGSVTTIMNAYNGPGTGLQRLAQSFQARKWLDSNKTVLDSGFGFNSAGNGTGTWAATNISMLGFLDNQYKRQSNWYGRSTGDGQNEFITTNGGSNNKLSIGNGAGNPTQYSGPGV